MKPAIDSAESLILYSLLKHLDPARRPERVHTIEHACVEISPAAPRWDLLADTTAWSILITQPNDAWTVRVCMACRDGDLVRPYASHAKVDRLWDDEDQHGGPVGVVPLFGAWLRSLPF